MAKKSKKRARRAEVPDFLDEEEPEIEELPNENLEEDDSPDEEEPEKPGLRCPECDGVLLRTVYTRKGPGNMTLRRKLCDHCKHRFTTSERVSKP